MISGPNSGVAISKGLVTVTAVTARAPFGCSTKFFSRWLRSPISPITAFSASSRFALLADHPHKLKHGIGEREPAIRRSLARMSIRRTFAKTERNKRISLGSTRVSKKKDVIQLENHAHQYRFSSPIFGSIFIAPRILLSFRK
jgi:hypothetical protein